MAKIRLTRVGLWLVVVSTVLIGLFLFRDQRRLAKAEQLVEHGLWEYAQGELGPYLWLHPNDDKANWLMAEALVRGQKPVEQAVAHLRRIPEGSQFACAARTKEGRLEFLVLSRPFRAEKLFRQAIELDVDADEPHFMLWKLYEMTGRSDNAERFFWRVYERTPKMERGMRLRDWYMSQFYPSTVTTELDRLIGVLAPDQPSTTETKAERYLLYKHSESDGPIGYASVAHWLQEQGDPKSALQVLEDAFPNLSDEDRRHPFFLASLVGALVGLGDYERAETEMKHWPEPRDGYDFWYWQGVLMDESQRKYNEALQAYSRAIQVWPGAVDWRIRTRMANCHARLGDQKRAKVLRDEAKYLQELMDESVHRRLRDSLGHLESPEKLQQVADFYVDVNRPKEAACWNRYIRDLDETTQ